jgi:Ca2+-binding RTX toxin-like protein
MRRKRAFLVVLAIGAWFVAATPAWGGPPNPSIDVQPQGAGTGTIDGQGFVSGDIFNPDCEWDGTPGPGTRSGDCEQSFGGVESVQIAATATGGSTWVGWDGTCPGTVTGADGTICTFSTDDLPAGVTTIRPEFAENAAILTLNPQGAGAGNLTATGDDGGVSLDCDWNGSATSGDCTDPVGDLPETVTVTATVASGSTFGGFTNCPGVVSGPDNTICTFTVLGVDDDVALGATFGGPDTEATITVAAEGTGAGTVTGTSAVRGVVVSCSWNGTTLSGDCTDAVGGVDTITLVATAAGGSTFGGWAACPGTVSGSGGNTCTLSVDSPADDFTARAIFGEQPLPPGCDIGGTEGDDELVGTAGPETICGLGGNDVIRGLGGNDILLGGLGDDRLIGGDGNDDLAGGVGNDRLNGGDGTDELGGGSGADNLSGGAGTDSMSGGGGADVLFGNAGSDTQSGGGGDDRLNGGRGSDVLSGGPGFDRANGGRGNDACTAERKTSC